MNPKLEQPLFVLLLALVTGAFLLVLMPFAAPLLWAVIIAVLFAPMQRWLTRKWGERPNLTALTTLAGCFVVIVAPVLFLLASVLRQGISIYQRIESGDLDIGRQIQRVQETFPSLQSFLERIGVDVPSLREDVTNTAVSGTQLLAEEALSFSQGTFLFVLKLGIMLYVAFFLLRDGRALVEIVVRTVPMGEERQRLLMRKFAEVARATVKGNVIVAIIQGTLGGIIFWILGLPAALLWGVIMTVLSLIPAIGAGLIWLPAAIYLFAIGDWPAGIVLVLFGVFVIGLVDNILRPILVGRDTKLPDWLVLLSTLGGLALVGINGFVVGPLIAVLFIAFWQIYSKEN